MRRKAGILLSIEIAILQAGVGLMRTGTSEFYGYAIAKEIRDQEAARRLTAHGTLYRALERMEKAGLLASRWEDPSVAASEERPRRRLYTLTAEAETALQGALERAPEPTKPLKRGLAPS
ncbi:MAG: helix-turn-helix transcriptional regulator [Dehalococcoidia bacterium]